MRYNNIRLISTQGNAFAFPLSKSINSSIYQLRAAEGLGPPDLNPGFTTRTDIGRNFNGANALGRQLVLTIGFQPAYSAGQTVGDLREKLYELADSRYGTPIYIQFMQDAATVVIGSGYVSKMEPDIFSQDPQLVITIECESPYLSAPTNTVVNQNQIAGTIVNPGTAPTGFQLQFTYVGASGNNTWGMYFAGMYFGLVQYNYVTGDQIIINTNYGIRSAILARSGVSINLLSALDPSSEWPMLYPGSNVFTSTFTSAKGNAVVYTFKPQYLGV